MQMNKYWPWLAAVALLITSLGGMALAQEQDPKLYLPLIGTGGDAPNPAGAPNTQTDENGHNVDGHDHDHDHQHLGIIPEHGRFTTNDGREMSWPPQLKYIQDVEYDDNTLQITHRRAGEANALYAAAAQNSDIQALLGQRHVQISAVPIMEKWDDTVHGHRITYFSYSNNITIEAIVANDVIESIQTYAAEENQPPLGPGEKEASVDIAREYWQSRGNTRVDDLEGFVIQTFVTEGEGGFYDTRMTYVSFHLDEVSPPELLTWVDLTTETVFRAAVDHGINNGGVQYEQ